MPLVWTNDCGNTDSDVAPALQRTQAELERSRLEDDMERKIWQRPPASELVEQGILEGKQKPTMYVLYSPPFYLCVS
jgi:hypothetical protein